MLELRKNASLKSVVKVLVARTQEEWFKWRDASDQEKKLQEKARGRMTPEIRHYGNEAFKAAEACGEFKNLTEHLARLAGVKLEKGWPSQGVRQ